MKLKICGLKYADNIRQIAELEPDYMGFVFVSSSKRFVGDDFLMPAIDPAIKKVGVFFNAPVGYIEEKVKRYGLNYAQLHGHEPSAFCAQVKQFTQVIKAFGLGADFNLQQLDDYKTTCNYFLFDHQSESYGGVGEPMQLQKLQPYDNAIPYFIGGSMDLDKYLVLQKTGLKPYGIDISSKAEIKPGYKDIIKVIQLRNRVR